MLWKFYRGVQASLLMATVLFLAACSDNTTQSCVPGNGAFAAVCCKDTDCTTPGTCHGGVCTRACGGDAGTCDGLAPGGGTAACNGGFCATPVVTTPPPQTAGGW